jgi:hypothetical protein
MKIFLLKNLKKIKPTLRKELARLCHQIYASKGITSFHGTEIWQQKKPPYFWEPSLLP